ncbi:MAG TPA: crosslink repair DNA glycosylase YcaQ family protein, partial [Bryobacteraceae bacterium]|nr:crosslink repair DNA glycosylase YcaQ family protein [Bryobacteraceae bacterium]
MPTAAQADLSLLEARRIALAAQGFDRPRPQRPPTPRDLAGMIRRLGIVQLDFVNLVVPAHYQVPFARFGPYPRKRLDDLIYRSGDFTEQWAHVASIVPAETWPLLRHRMASRRFWPYGFEKILDANPGYFEWVLEQVRERGPLLPENLPEPPGVARRLPESWFGTVPRATLEAHFARGRIAIANRLPNFART